ncbi:MAG TPA: class II aldolase/adducin family protein [Casimicrobiaceae bacterium]|nr:class II aldolase/adducin family protein [Casimicrobiaceae bacterium]
MIGVDPAERLIREQVIATALGMNAAGINRAKAGNVSARWRSAAFDGFLVTPSGVPYDRLAPEDIVAMTIGGASRGSLAPSSEWRFHRDIYAARPEAHAIVHAHSPFCTTLACLGRGIPPFHYMVAVAGGSDIRCAPYATFGSQALAGHVVAALQDRRACLIANHGMVVFADDLSSALQLAIEVESLAETYWRALLVGEPVLLDEGEMARVVAKFATYGQARPRER